MREKKMKKIVNKEIGKIIFLLEVILELNGL